MSSPLDEGRSYALPGGTGCPDVGRVDLPVAALPHLIPGAAGDLQEALVERQVVPDRVLEQRERERGGHSRVFFALAYNKPTSPHHHLPFELTARQKGVEKLAGRRVGKLSLPNALSQPFANIKSLKLARLCEESFKKCANCDSASGSLKVRVPLGDGKGS